MKYRSVECSGQGLRYDIITPGGERICIAHSERDANAIAQAMNKTLKPKTTFAAYWKQSTEAVRPDGLYTLEQVRGLAKLAFEVGRDNA